MAVKGDSAARGQAVRMVREESERFWNTIRGHTFYPPAKRGRWYKATQRDLMGRLKRGLIGIIFSNKGTKREVTRLVVVEVLDDFLGCSTYDIDRWTMQVTPKELPIKLTIHFLQRLLQDGMEPTLDSLTERVTPAFFAMAGYLGQKGMPEPDKKVALWTEGGMVGCVANRTRSDLVARTWIPRS